MGPPSELPQAFTTMKRQLRSLSAETQLEHDLDSVAFRKTLTE